MKFRRALIVDILNEGHRQGGDLADYVLRELNKIDDIIERRNKIQQLSEKIRQEFDKGMNQVENETKELRSSCKHQQENYKADKDGSYWECDLCGRTRF